jgi:acetyltransferase-like isoleucine patch superfamily enzyme
LGVLNAGKVIIGDVSLLASDCRVFIPTLIVGDYVKIHNHTLINGRKACFIGHNSWIGQNNILNAEDTLVIGNHVGLGIYTSIWTHAYYGDLLEGCNTFKVAPTIIGDDVWVVGAYNVVAPGVEIGNKAMVMTHSLVAKNIPSNHCVAGVPAKDITDKIEPYRMITLEDKFQMLRGFIQEFLRTRYPDAFATTPTGFLIKHDGHQFEIAFMEVADDQQIREDGNKIIVAKRNLSKRDYKFVTIFDLERREYTKHLTDLEIELVSFLLSYRARFTPVGYPTVGSEVTQ